MTPKAGHAPTRMPDLVMWSTAFALSLGQWRHTAYFFGNCDASAMCDMSDVARALQAELGVLAGYPHWRYFQSRLLGPWAENVLHLLFGFNFLAAHMVVAIVVSTLCGAVMFYAGRAIGGRQSGWSALFAFQECWRQNPIGMRCPRLIQNERSMLTPATHSPAGPRVTETFDCAALTALSGIGLVHCRLLAPSRHVYGRDKARP